MRSIRPSFGRMRRPARRSTPGRAEPSSAWSASASSTRACWGCRSRSIATSTRSTCASTCGGAAAEGWRRGVVFVKEIVPRAAIAAIARLALRRDATWRCRCATRIAARADPPRRPSTTTGASAAAGTPVRRRRAAPPTPLDAELGGGVHHRALLGLRGPATAAASSTPSSIRAGTSGRRPSSRLDCRRGRSLQPGLRRAPEPRADLRLRRRRLADLGPARRALAKLGALAELNQLAPPAHRRWCRAVSPRVVGFSAQQPRFMAPRYTLDVDEAVRGQPARGRLMTTESVTISLPAACMPNSRRWHGGKTAAWPRQSPGSWQMLCSGGPMTRTTIPVLGLDRRIPRRAGLDRRHPRQRGTRSVLAERRTWRAGRGTPRLGDRSPPVLARPGWSSSSSLLGRVGDIDAALDQLGPFLALLDAVTAPSRRRCLRSLPAGCGLPHPGDSVR